MNIKKALIWSGAIVSVIAVGAFSAYSYVAYDTAKKWEDKIFPSVTIENIDVGGKTREEAISTLQKEFADVTSNKEIKIKYQDKEKNLSFNEFQPQYNIEGAIEEAITEGKEASFYEKYRTSKNGLDKDLTLKYSFNEEKVTEVSASIEAEVNRDPVNATIKKSSGFVFTDEVIGYKVNLDKLKTDLIDSLKTIDEKAVAVEATVDVLEPSVKKEQLATIDSNIGSFTTNYSLATAGRAENVRIGTSEINGTLLMPGEEFSWERIAGDALASEGYQEANVILDGKFVPGIGGGICQVSTTLYNAIMKTGLNTTDRRGHTDLVGYVQPGHDAMIAYGWSDMKFVNTFEYPIYIEGYTYKKDGRGYVTFNMYSARNAKPANVDYQLESRNLVKSGNVTKVDVYRKKIVDGVVVEEPLISKNTYESK